jgi:phage gp37-like protein
MYTVTQIEDAIIDALKDSVMGTYCKKIDSYQLEEAEDIEKQIQLFALNLPCALVIYSEGIYARYPNKRLDLKMRFSILLCAQNLRGEGEPRRGTVGTYKMINDLRTILTGKRLDLEIDPLFPVRETSEVNTASFSAYSIEFETKCTFTF